MSCLQDLLCTMIHIETDCSDLVDMIANLTDWPVFASELISFKRLKVGFSVFSINCILRIRNLILSRRRLETAEFSFPI
ncbi:unnamed protein product [Brassica rapa]|uniref:RNase H type-1 domain-containing protein n=1 Tax=Brassica campestris TaxID=3711 RepID=A0A8D9MAD2_BRACM|nr:unnamed protein product [Brassica rapa]